MRVLFSPTVRLLFGLPLLALAGGCDAVAPRPTSSQGPTGTPELVAKMNQKDAFPPDLDEGATNNTQEVTPTEIASAGGITLTAVVSRAEAGDVDSPKVTVFGSTASSRGAARDGVLWTGDLASGSGVTKPVKLFAGNLQPGEVVIATGTVQATTGGLVFEALQSPLRALAKGASVKKEARELATDVRLLQKSARMSAEDEDGQHLGTFSVILARGSDNKVTGWIEPTSPSHFEDTRLVLDSYEGKHDVAISVNGVPVRQAFAAAVK